MNEDSYPGDDGRGSYFFPLKLWIEFQSCLVATEAIMRMCANKYKLKYLSNIRGEWPARRLKTNSIFKSCEITMMLNPNYLQDKNIFYELNKSCTVNVANLYVRILEKKVIKKYSIDEMKNVELIKKDVEDVISNIIKG